MTRSGAVRRAVVCLGGGAVAALVLVTAVNAHLRTACFERDTPYLPICAETPASPDDEAAELRRRIERNPGDSRAWTRLLMSTPESPKREVLGAAAVLAPNEPNVARRRAVAELEQGRTAPAVDLLIDLVRHRGSGAAAQALAAIASTPEGLAALKPHFARAEWLGPTLAAGAAAKIAPPVMLPLLIEALNRDALPVETRQAYMRSLKERGFWVDAWGLWLAQHKEPVPLLYNGSFDQPIEDDGFDWEFAPVPRTRAGVLVEQEAAAQRGMVLVLEFTGRSFNAPIMRQYLFTAPGTYRIRGEYMASKFRSEAGLNWTVRCTAGAKNVTGRSNALLDTGGVWRPLQIDFVVPPDCGAVASLQLEPTAAYEAQTGMRGQMSFDNLSLTHAMAPS